MIRNLIIGCVAFALISCTTMSYRKAINELQNLPPADYSYILEPNFRLSKEALEEKLIEFYDAEEAKVGASGNHGYSRETKEQINEKFWLKAVVLNSTQIGELDKEDVNMPVAKEIASEVLDAIVNAADYSEIEIVLMQQWNDGEVKTIKRSYLFTVPNLVEIKM